MVLACTIEDNNKNIRSHALVDQGATRYVFAEEDFVRCYNLPLFKLKEPRGLEVIDGRPVVSGDITHITKVRFMVDKHVEELPMFVTKLGHYPIILGIPWLRRHDVRIGFASNTVTFDSPFCLQHCCPVPAKTEGISILIPKPVYRIVLTAGSTFTQAVSRYHCHKVDIVGSFTIYKLRRAIDHLTPHSESLDLTTDDDEKLRAHVPKDYHNLS